MNILAPSLGAIIHASSNPQRAANLFTEDERQMWLSNSTLPIELVIDLADITVEYDAITQISLVCWHDYSSNPAKVAIYVNDNREWVSWQTLHLELKGG
jgi:hypothetical protein